jgi:arylsulfatase A-like enzyme
MVKSRFNPIESALMKKILLQIKSWLLSGLCMAGLQAAEPVRPNLVVILVDDMGYSDIGCYGSEIPTPNLDSLAAEGVRFSQFYNAGRCCPTRASLLTGLYPHQAGVGYMTENRGLPGYEGKLNERCVTIAELLRPAGYFTAMAGKWHVGQNQGVVPWERGFDRSLNAAAGGFYFPGSAKTRLFLNGEALKSDDPRLPRDWYSTDLWTEFGLRFVDEALAERKPFFLYLAHNAPHFPLQAPEESIAPFRGRYQAGWDVLRSERQARQIASGLIDPAWTMAPRPEEVAAWDSLTKEEKDRFDSLMAVYAAVVHRMDKAVGDLVNGLKARGVYENTLILFLSDNGGNAESGPTGRSNGLPFEAESSWFCGESWAYLQNTPFRYYKHYNHEGGIASPLIAHWPAGRLRQGMTVDEPAHLIDILATCAAVAGAGYPEQLDGRKIQPMEGQSLLPLFIGEPFQRQEPLFFEHEGNRAMRDGRWKIVAKGFDGAWELYDMTADRGETNNLAEEQLERVKTMAGQWEAWAKHAQVKPYPSEKREKKTDKRKTGKQNDE